MSGMRRLVAVSNRAGPITGAAAAGGLAVGIVDALRDYGGLWFGWSGRIAAAGKARLHSEKADGLTLATLDLTQRDFDGYYNGFSNSCLWPLLHFRMDITEYEPGHLEAYKRVNRLFAKRLHRLLRPDDLIWIHDFHLIPLAAELRRLGARQKIGFFLHTPFPPTDVLSCFPEHDWIVRSLLAYDLLGFQTSEDNARFEEHIRRAFKGAAGQGAPAAFSRKARTGTFPIGIDVEQYRSFAFSGPGERNFRRMRAALGSRDQIIGVDRLDYSKGLLRRVAAFGSYLGVHPEAHGQVIFLQIAPVSRGGLKSYRQFRHELELAAGRVNGRYARFDWTPFQYLNRTTPRRTLAGLYRASRVGFVTPVRDGMNLVAKEYVAAQDGADPGVLILSRFAGAAQQMGAALLVNPFNGEEMVQALHLARQMPAEERRNRHAKLYQGLLEYDVKRWRNEFVEALQATPARAAAASDPA